MGRLQPFYKSFGKRLVKTPKLYFLDTGVVTALLGIQHPDELAFHAQRGSLFESWVTAEILKQYYNAGRAPQLFYSQYASVMRSTSSSNAATIWWRLR